MNFFLHLNHREKYIGTFLVLLSLLLGTTGYILLKNRSGATQIATVTTAPGTSFTRYQRPDGSYELYYAAGDPILQDAFTLLDSYWSTIPTTSNLARGYLDEYLPQDLSKMDYKPGNTLMQGYANTFFSARNPTTGLIPYSFNSTITFKDTQYSTDNKQPLILPDRAAAFINWFPSDQSIRQKSLDFAKSVVKQFNIPSKTESSTGLKGWTNVKDPNDYIPHAVVLDYGGAATGLDTIAKATGNSEITKWVDAKTDYVWSKRFSSNLPLIPDVLTPSSAEFTEEGKANGTDSLYYTRRLYKLFALTGNTKYRDEALTNTDYWYNHAWDNEHHHFVGKIDTTTGNAYCIPRWCDNLYGDSKWNTLFVLVNAYEVTHDTKYLDRFKDAWLHLRAMGQNGQMPSYVRAGAMVKSYGIETGQVKFLDVLVEAYQASHQAWMKDEAVNFATTILPTATNTNSQRSSGRIFLSLALALHAIHRLEVNVGTGTQLSIHQGSTKVFDLTSKSQVAVVYLPENTYTVSAKNNTNSWTKSVSLSKDQSVKAFSVPVAASAKPEGSTGSTTIPSTIPTPTPSTKPALSPTPTVIGSPTPQSTPIAKTTTHIIPSPTPTVKQSPHTSVDTPLAILPARFTATLTKALGVLSPDSTTSQPASNSYYPVILGFSLIISGFVILGGVILHIIFRVRNHSHSR